MHELTVTTDIDATPAACFDAARDLGLHVDSAAKTRERVVHTTSATGLLGLNDVVTFEAVHLGVRQRLTAEVVVFDPPRFFRDRMTRGAFRSMEHDHRFDPLPGGGTRMTDTLRFEAPLGPLGRVLGRLVLVPHLRSFLRGRGEVLKRRLEEIRTAPDRSRATGATPRSRGSHPPSGRPGGWLRRVATEAAERSGERESARGLDWRSGGSRCHRQLPPRGGGATRRAAAGGPRVR